MKTSRNVAVIVAGGAGKRFGGDTPKQFLALSGKPIIAYTLDIFEKSELIDEIVLVVSEDYFIYASKEIVDKFGYKKIKKITAGGESRRESVFAGLSACPAGIDLAVIHDSVRPFLASDLLRKVILKAAESGGAILAVPAKESVKKVRGDKIEKTLLRDTVWIAQTPQVFKFDSILDAHRRAETAQNEATDDSQLYEQYCGDVTIVRGSYNNIKITTRHDYILAREMIKELG